MLILTFVSEGLDARELQRPQGPRERGPAKRHQPVERQQVGSFRVVRTERGNFFMSTL